MSEAKPNLFEVAERTGKGRRPKLEAIIKYQPQVYERILMFIERGAYDYVAAEAFGVTQETFSRWFSKGKAAYDSGRPGIYRQFFEDVTTAKARARLLAEVEVRAQDPKFFLLNGPGKSEPGRPGWTAPSGNDANNPYAPGTPTGNPRKEIASNADLSQTLAILQDLGMIPSFLPENEGGGANVLSLPQPTE